MLSGYSYFAKWAIKIGHANKHDIIPYIINKNVSVEWILVQVKQLYGTGQKHSHENNISAAVSYKYTLQKLHNINHIM